jgi:SAM-dependent methyltransferase
MTDLAFHQLRGVIGEGDLHPGGVATTEMLLAWLSRYLQEGSMVLEVGAGIGNTATRMADRGWSVVALEPDPVLFGILRTRREVTALNVDLLSHTAPDPYDAVVAESVLFMTDLERALSHIHSLLRPGGALALVDAVWTERVSPQAAVEIHERSLRLFGIPVASRRRLTWSDWRRALGGAGFGELQAARVTQPQASTSTFSRMLRFGWRLVRHPRQALRTIEFRSKVHTLVLPEGALEAWAYLGASGPSQRAGDPGAAAPSRSAHQKVESDQESRADAAT